MKHRYDSLVFIGLVAPTLLILGIFVIYPAMKSFYLSFHEVDPFSHDHTWVGFSNYKELLKSEEFWKSFKVTILFSLITVLPSLVFSTGLAVLLNAQPYFQRLFRTIFLLPVSISSAMAAMLWIFIFNPTAGILNYIVGLIFSTTPNWLSDPNWALLAVAVVTIWKEIGFNIIFILAGLSTISQDLIDSAIIDGATRFRIFFSVVLPLLAPTLLFVGILTLIHSFQAFGQIHILTKGGPAYSTTTLLYHLYLDAFVHFRIGTASAQAALLFISLVLLASLQFWLNRRLQHV